MTGLSRRARWELGLYRAAATCYRGLLAARCAFDGSPQRRLLAERLGRWSGAPAAPLGCIWVHAASLGEVLTATPLIARLHAEAPALRIVLTTNTATGRAAGGRTLADEVRAFPVDTPSAVRAVTAHIRPVAFVFVETEIWPSLLLLLAEQGVATALVGASISERSLKRYLAVRSVFAAALGTLAAACARDEEARARLLALGAPPACTRVTGDLKSDVLDDAAIAATADPLAGIPAVLVAASTHEGEDETVLTAFRRVRSRHPRARLVLAPRHAERAGTVADAAMALGLRTLRWSSKPAASAWDVLVLDTSGELRGFFRSAAAVFVGGSLVPIGGHNLFEPAAFGRAMAAGASLDGVREQADALARAGALTIVADVESLAAYWLSCLEAPSEAARAGLRARDVVRNRGGAIERTLDALRPLLAPHARGQGGIGGVVR